MELELKKKKKNGGRLLSNERQSDTDLAPLIHGVICLTHYIHTSSLTILILPLLSQTNTAHLDTIILDFLRFMKHI